MSQISEISASAYTLEMETLGALPDIPTFDGEPVPVSRNPLTLGTRPLQLLPLPGTKFPVRYETSRMRDFQTEARSGGSATDASTFWDLLDLPMRARVVAVGFGDYAAGLRRTQPRFPRYALMERWNDCTHTFVFGFGEMTLTPMDYAAITGLRFTGPIPPLDARYQTATLGAQLVRSLLGVTTQTRYGHTSIVSTQGVRAVTLLPSLGGSLVIWPIVIILEDPEYQRSFLNDWELSDLFLTPWDCEAWRTYLGWEVAELHTRSRLLMRGYWADRYFLGERVDDTPVAPAQRGGPHAPPRHMCLLEGLTREDLEVEYRGFSANDFLPTGDFPTYFSSRMQARLPEILEYAQEWKMHKTAAHYRAEAAAEAGAAVAPTGLAGAVLGDLLFPPSMEGGLDPSLGLGSGIIIPADLRQAPPPVQLDPEYTTHVPDQRYKELCERFEVARSYIGRLYFDVHERDLEIGRLQRHQSRQSSTVSRLQAEVDRLRTRLEVEGIPLDSSDEDDDGSSDDTPPSPPPQAAAGPSRRRQ
ncbi:hypothetical protein JCGZ_07902 [Jatropha curcas]|uniref:Aminotransferase-like plant mobile domain-containing protein n=1 Tax=Jatropha curcas TaxID=180498 RepID=A0A067KXX7_JATCU|nr:hypothetical protein JCGZ_07902 [Jatropha curcas]